MTRIGWGLLIRGLALRYGWTFDYILDMTLDQFAAACEETDAEPARAEPKWAVPIGGPEDLERLWNERQLRRGLTNGG